MASFSSLVPPACCCNGDRSESESWQKRLDAVEADKCNMLVMATQLAMEQTSLSEGRRTESPVQTQVMEAGSVDLCPPTGLRFSIGKTGEIYIHFPPAGELGATDEGVFSGHWVGRETFLALDPFVQRTITRIGRGRRQRARRKLQRLQQAAEGQQ